MSTYLDWFYDHYINGSSDDVFHTCSTCYAAVPEAYEREHVAWHANTKEN